MERANKYANHFSLEAVRKLTFKLFFNLSTLGTLGSFFPCLDGSQCLFEFSVCSLSVSLVVKDSFVFQTRADPK